MKKIIHLFVICMVFFMTVSFNNVYAVNENLVIERNVLKDGHVEMIISIDKDANVYGGRFVVEYNKDNLKLESVEANKDKKMLVAVNKDYKKEGNKIKASFASTDLIEGKVFAITLKNINKKVSNDDVIVKQLSVSDKDSKVNSSITESTVTYVNEKKESQIDDSFEDVSKLENSQTKTYSSSKDDDTKNTSKSPETTSKTNKTTKQTNKATKTKKNTNYVPYVVALIVVIGVFIIYKFKRK